MTKNSAVKTGTPYIKFNNVTKEYRVGDVVTKALDNASLEIEKGELCVIVGASGAGKTTLLNIMGGMDTMTSGSAVLDGTELSSLNKNKLNNFRRYKIGFVFQFYNLIQNLNARENVELASQISRSPLAPDEILAKVGLSERITNYPSQLSGGEQQRVAIARALAKDPKLLLCDEPTGALDYNTGKSILKLLQDTCRKSKMTAVIITHNQAIAAMADRIIEIKNGIIKSVVKNMNIVPVEEIEW